MRKGLPPGWRISEEYSEPRQAEYVKKMVEEISAIPRIKVTGPTHWQGKLIADLTAEEREAFYFSEQQPSTQAALLAQKTRKPEEDLDHLLRPMPECIANPNATSLDELTAKRALDPQDMILHITAAQGRNTIGQGDAGSVDREKRQKGIEAFTYSKPAVLTPEQEKKLTRLEEIVNTPLEPPEPKKRWFSGFWSKFHGNHEFKN